MSAALTTESVLSAEIVLFWGAPAYGLVINIPDPVDYSVRDERQPSFAGAKVSLKDCTFELFSTALRVTPGADVSAAGCTFWSCYSSALVVGSELKAFRWPSTCGCAATSPQQATSCKTQRQNAATRGHPQTCL